jgi:hypothetical protein
MRQRPAAGRRSRTQVDALRPSRTTERCLLESLDLAVPSNLFKCISEAERELSGLRDSLNDHDYLKDCARYLEELRARLPSCSWPELAELPDLPSLSSLSAMLDTIHRLASQLPSSPDGLPDPPSIPADVLVASGEGGTGAAVQRVPLPRRNTFSKALAKGIEEGERLLGEGERLFDEFKDVVKHEGERVAGILSHEGAA